MEIPQCAGPPSGKIRCLHCGFVSDGKVSVSSYYMSPETCPHRAVAAITVQCPYCRAVCLRIKFPCDREAAGDISLRVRSRTAELEYWPRALIGALGQMMPSVRPDTPETPVSGDDVEKCKAQLSEISFERNTESWQTFLERLLREPEWNPPF